MFISIQLKNIALKRYHLVGIFYNHIDGYIANFIKNEL